MDAKLKLDYPKKDGTTLREHLIQVGMLDSVEEPDVPDAVANVWEWFWELDSGRKAGMSTNPISWEAILAWAKLTGTEPTPWEVEAIKALDNRYMKFIAEKAK